MKKTYQLLEGKRGIIFGALNQDSIAWSVAKRAKEEGANFVLTNAPIATKIGKLNQLAEECNAPIVIADATKVHEIEDLYEKSMEHLGGKIDFILHSIGMSKNVTKKRDYADLNYTYFLQAIDISAISLHKILQVAYKKDYLNEFASVLALSYIGAQRTFNTYIDMAQAKAVLESIVRSFGNHYGIKRNVRINTISQSPTMTTAGKTVPGFDSFYHYSNAMSPLGNATAEECADFCMMMFSDLSRKVTMQNIYHDGGFSSVGISSEVLKHYKPEEEL